MYKVQTLLLLKKYSDTDFFSLFVWMWCQGPTINKAWHVPHPKISQLQFLDFFNQTFRTGRKKVIAWSLLACMLRILSSLAVLIQTSLHRCEYDTVVWALLSWTLKFLSTLWDLKKNNQWWIKLSMLANEKKNWKKKKC